MCSVSTQIQIVDYDSRWPELSTREAARIRSILESRALSIEHVGSTPVPGLPAKPVIDLLLVVANSANEAAYVPHLEAAGYVLRFREPHWHEHRLLNGQDTDINLHVLSDGCPEIERIESKVQWNQGNKVTTRMRIVWTPA